MPTYSYKCPSCSGPLEFKPELGKLKCDYCGSDFTTEQIDEYIKNNPDKEILVEKENEAEDLNSTLDEELNPEADIHQESGETSEYDENIDHMAGYNCQNCGAEVVTTDTTMTTFCYYCHSPVVITDRAQGEFKPSKLIPFKIDKKKAEDVFLNWAKSKRYVEKNFYSQSQLEKITGMYLPYWSIDADFEIDLQGEAYKRTMYRRGDTEYTDTSSYKVDRIANYQIANLSEVAYSKVDKQHLDSITPYNFEESVPFRTYYLNGFFSETYDKNYDSVKDKLLSRAESLAKKSVTESLSEYSSYNLSREEYQTKDLKKDYLLLPTWMMTYDYKDKKYIYAMNGQTGKAFGDLPIDNKLIVRDALLIGFVAFIGILLGGAFIW